MKLLTAALAASMTAATPSEHVVLSVCAPRQEALEVHKSLGYALEGVKLTADDVLMEKWRDRDGRVFVTATPPEGGKTCLVGKLPDEPEI